MSQNRQLGFIIQGFLGLQGCSAQSPAEWCCDYESICCNLPVMLIGEKLRKLRESKKLSQGDIEGRTGLIRCYTSRVENGHTVPSIGTLEKYARALEVPIYHLFYEGEEPPKPPKLPKGKIGDGDSWGYSGKDARTLHRFRVLLKRMGQRDRDLLFSMAVNMGRRKTRRAKT